MQPRACGDREAPGSARPAGSARPCLARWPGSTLMGRRDRPGQRSQQSPTLRSLMRSSRDTKLLPQRGIYLPISSEEGEWQGRLWARAERQGRVRGCRPCTQTSVSPPCLRHGTCRRRTGTQTVQHSEGSEAQAGPRPGQAPPSSSCTRPLGWDRLNVSTWSRPAQACPPVYTRCRRSRA